MSLNDKYLFGIPDLWCVIHGTLVTFEIKIVRNNNIKLQPRQLRMTQLLEDAGAISGFLLYYPKLDKYGLFTAGEIQRKCYKKENIPEDIKLLTQKEFLSWAGISLIKPGPKSSLASIR